MTEPNDALHHTARLVSAYVSTNSAPPRALPDLIRAVYGAISAIERGSAGPNASVSISASITPDYLICLEDGKRCRTLKRYLRTRYGLTPREYRLKWHLPSDYPMTAPSYSKRRSELAKKIGLGNAAKRRRRKRP